MPIDALITLGTILLAVILFATERIPVDLVALLIMGILIFTGVISPEEGIAGFSNQATITVLFMFILSHALFKTAALQVVAYRLSELFKRNFLLGMILMMILLAIVSAFVNNTPVVAVFIPVAIQIAHASGRDPRKMLIPVSYASIFGGCCTLLGTSTNILVDGIAESEGVAGLNMFTLTPVAVVLALFGLGYLSLIGIKILPGQESGKKDLTKRFGFGDYLTELQLLPGAVDIGQRIMDSQLVREYGMDIIEIRRNGQIFNLPPGDFYLKARDLLKVRCDIGNLKTFKDRSRALREDTIRFGEGSLAEKDMALVELVIPAESEMENKTLKEVDFRHRFRAIPLAIRQRNEILHNQLYRVPLRAGDVILAEMKRHFVKEVRKKEPGSEVPFVLLSEDKLVDFNRRNFLIVLGVLLGIVITSATGLLELVTATLAGVLILFITGCLGTREAYRSVNWRIIFLLAGSLSMGTAMRNTGLDIWLAETLIGQLGNWGPIAILSGMYLMTSLLTEIMTNNATAALVAPVAIATAQQLGLDPLPFLVAITLASSASFMTPVGYQTNTMVYGAGNYRFADFLKVGVFLNLTFWLVSTFLIPLIYPF